LFTALGNFKKLAGFSKIHDASHHDLYRTVRAIGVNLYEAIASYEAFAPMDQDGKTPGRCSATRICSVRLTVDHDCALSGRRVRRPFKN
jgi:hypothetical protein